MDEQRIKIAEAMGWTLIRKKHVPMDGKSYYFGCQPADQYSDGRINERYKQHIPDPFTDANDDYAVLQWVRNNWQGQDGHYGHWNQFARSIWWSWDEYDVTIPYQVGDYARAALAVLQFQTPE